MKRSFYLSILLLFFTANGITADLGDNASPLPVITGENKLVRAVGDETLMEIARREGYGFDILANSNKNIDPWKPGEGKHVLLPGEAIVPAGAKPGLIINLAELRLFHIYPKDSDYKIDIYPLGIGREGRETPEGHFKVIVKKEKPDWRVPEGLRELDPGLPKIVPPGPKNPLGDYWLGISAPGYGVHGTNRPFGVGRRVSYGCMRMYAQHIKHLFRLIEPGTPVQIEYQSIKAARNGDYLLLEVHPDYLERYNDPFQKALTAISKTGWHGDLDYARVKEVVEEQKSVPQIIGMISTSQQ